METIRNVAFPAWTMLPDARNLCRSEGGTDVQEKSAQLLRCERARDDVVYTVGQHQVHDAVSRPA